MVSTFQAFRVCISLLSFTTTIFAHDCFFANGTSLPDASPYDQTAPCKEDGLTTICCALNRSNKPGGNLRDGYPADECLPNGLCQNRLVENGEMKTQYWLNFCTDSDYTSGKCLDLCREYREPGGSAQITPCDGSNTSERWCCGSKTTCCTNNIDVIELPAVFNGRAVTLSNKPASTRTTSTGTSTPAAVTTSSNTSPSSSSASQSAQSEKKGLSSGAKAGIGVGVTLGVFALFGAAFFVFKALSWRKKGRMADANASGENSYPPSYPPDKYQHVESLSAESAPVELAPDSVVTELPVTVQSPSELPGHSK
jgi:hypothetical protein